MVDTVNVEYLYPPKLLDGRWDEHSGNRRVIARLSGLSDGTGETDVTKIRLADLKTASGKVPTRTAVEWIQWMATGLTVLLEWDRAPNAEIIRIDADANRDSGEVDWACFGGKLDPGEDDRTGNILLSTTSADNGDSYEITVCLRLKD